MALLLCTLQVRLTELVLCTQMSAEQVPALLEVVVALASSSNCAQVLDPGYQAPTNVKMSDAADSGHAQPPSFRQVS